MNTFRKNPGTNMASRQAEARVGVLRNVTALNLMLMLAAVLFLAGYIVMNNRAAAKAFSIREEELRIAELKDEKQQLDLAIVSAQAMDAIDASVQGLGLVPVARVDYVTAAGGAVAVK